MLPDFGTGYAPMPQWILWLVWAAGLVWFINLIAWLIRFLRRRP